MALYTLTKGLLRLEVSGKGGSIEGFWRQEKPLLRPGKKSGIATESSCFPLVPFGNRVSGNRFSWKDRQYELAPNVPWDKHYLHGDGWLGEWYCESRREESLLLTYKHAAGAYRYQATQLFRLTEDALTVTLTVTNEGRHSLPFGLGWHPYFPLAPETRLQAGASGYWKEREAWLAGEFSAQLPAALDFAQPSPLPRQWVNNAFAGWNGRAEIHQPQAGYRLSMQTDPPVPCYFIFVSDPSFDQGYAFDFFCLEPMSHAPDDHHRPGGGQLTTLSPRETTSLTMTLTVTDTGGITNDC